MHAPGPSSQTATGHHDDVPIKPNNHHHTDEQLRIDALGQIFCPWRHQGAKYDINKGSKAKTAITWQIFTIIRRLVIFSAALVYIARSIQSTLATIRVIRAIPLPTKDMNLYKSPLITAWTGTSTIRTSPLVVSTLKNTTTPIATTIYLTSSTTVSLTGCTDYLSVYNNTFLRTVGAGLLAQTMYNLTFLEPVELIAPVVDCQFDNRGNPSLLRTHYLVRHKINTDDVSLLTLSISMQDYAIPKQKQKGAAGVGTLSLINDMSMTTPVRHSYIVMQGYPYAVMKFQVYTMIGYSSDHDWRLLSVPAIVLAETPKEMVTACRSGMYINVETEQSNYHSTYAVPDTIPSLVLSRWRWRGGTVLRDTWGWVHCVHILFAADALINIVWLFLVIYRKLLLGKIWVGDAFVSVSNTLLYRGAIILLTWIVNDGWALMEFCYANAHHIIGDTVFYIEPAIMRADLLTLFLSLSSIVGSIFRERIDPALAVYLFEIGFSYRIQIGKGLKTVIQYAYDDLSRGILPMSPIVAQTTPMRLGTLHKLASKNVGFIMLSLLPTFSLLSVVVVFALVRKIYRHFYPEEFHVLKSSNASSHVSDRSDNLQSLKANLTYFEVATGAALQHRVGVVGDYENCLYIKGIKYASADGIYCSGYVIANGKFLIATTDLVAIFLMKILRLRFKNIYVYEVEGTTVQQTAQLVYPETIPWRNLLRLNISVLS